MYSDIFVMEFYPKNWQVVLTRNTHPWLLHTTIWYYWLWYIFILSMNLFFIYIYKIISYQKSIIIDVKLTLGKKKVAWPEILIILIPFYWVINIITNTLAYLRIFESNCGHVLLTVQVNSFQWGWKYSYNNMFYTKYFTNNIRVGYQKNFSLNNIPKLSLKNNGFLKNYKSSIIFENNAIFKKVANVYIKNGVENKIYNLSVNYNKSSNISIENYFCREWSKHFDNIENKLNNKILNKKRQNSYWITSQGLDTSQLNIKEFYPKNNKDFFNLACKDPLRLFRTTGALILPTKNTIRLISCSDDITHSWAVPSLGFKMDCVPGRIFCLYLNIFREGIYFGQCSELCGWNHYNMPIIVYAIPIEHFIIWWEFELYNLFNRKNNELNNNNFFEKKIICNINKE